jgi:hypothetical protein
MNGIISQIFPSLIARSASLPFVLFGAAMVAQFFVILFFFPKGPVVGATAEKIAP